MRILMLCAALAAFAAAPLFAIEILTEGQRFLQGTIQWVPSAIQPGSEDLAIVIGTGRSEQAVRFWSGGAVDSSQLEGLVGRQVGIDGKLHKYMDNWFVKADKLSLARGSETAAPAAPKASALSLEDKASGLAASWFKAREDAKLEPVVRIKSVEGHAVQLSVMGQDEDGSFKSRHNVTVNLDRLSIKKNWE